VSTDVIKSVCAPGGIVLIRTLETGNVD